MDRINKFLETRQQKHVKTLKYKEQTYTITKDDLKKVRAYKSSKCLDPVLKTIPNRILSNEQVQPVKERVKRDASGYFNRKLREHYINNPQPKVTVIPKNQIVDIWEDENLNTLKTYTQEWIYSIDTPYEGPVESLEFNKGHLEEELRRVYLKHFTPRDPKQKALKDILPKLPDIETMRPFPEFSSFSWELEGKKTLFNSTICAINEKNVVLLDLKYNKVLFNYNFEENIYKAALCGHIFIVSSKNSIYLTKLGEHVQPTKTIHSHMAIKDIYIDSSFIGYLTSKSIHLHHSTSYEEIKILKLKGDTPHTMTISEDAVYASTHKGIMVESIERSEIKNLGYVIDFEIYNKHIYAINNVGRLVIVNESLKVVGSTVQNDIGSQIKIHPAYGLIAIIFSNEICIYKILENQCIPINTISGVFKAISWDTEMPWLYVAYKNKIELFT
ncbi:uncharacterized protein VICG_01381 [Vittaforma corneae ATCC 50505]|uniref:BOP1 N-terminal domain-containing protein n=1 Tax=Vittaforma corneae (strain ATCC 50505) TaxID=993615 RepID=L2GL88_VITCO|nr:uncharacterized protein VICG_01381 [Vittaforma corneae ATCC 50505]ELA41633.1 hypothetical protein VICG_01381 [Vittaforma corneae ATCC 50505]